MTAVVGRDREVGAIRSFLGATETEGARVLLLAGQAGIGKTTLWEVGAQAARERGFQVLLASSSPADARVGFAALGDILGTVLEDIDTELPKPQKRALRVALALEEAHRGLPAHGTIAVAVLTTLRAAAKRQPVLVAVDDIQWLDESSASVLAYALRRLRSERIAFLFTQRTEGTAQFPLGLDRYPGPNIERISVGALSLGALHGIVSSRLGTTLTWPALRRLHETSAGNPFYALEIARSGAMPGDAISPGDPLPLPSSLDKLVAARLRTLPATTRALLLVVAALQKATTELVAQALEAPDLLEMLGPAIEADVIEISGDSIRFTHPLLAAAVYAGAGTAARRRVHHTLSPLMHSLEERARHLALSAQPPNAEIATTLEDASAAAFRRGSPSGAAELSEMAARFTSSQDMGDRRRRLCNAADFHLAGGDGFTAANIAQRIVAETPKSSDRARALFVLSFTEPNITKRVALAETALQEAQGEDALVARIRHWRGFIAVVLGPLQRARAEAKKALALGDAAGIVARAQSMALAVLADLLAGKPADDDLLAKAVILEKAAGTSVFYGPSSVLGLRYAFADVAVKQARAAFAVASRIAADHGDEHMLTALLLHETELNCRVGQFRLALECANDGYELARQLGIQDRVAIMAYAQALALGFIGEVSAARTKAEEALSLPGLWEVQTHAVLGLLELSLGDVVAADRHLRSLPDRLYEMGYGETWYLQAVPAAVEALVQLGEIDEANRVLSRYARLVRRSPSGRAAAARSRALIAAARGDSEHALARFADALREHENLDSPFEHARTLLLLGRVQRRFRQRSQARESLRTASDVFQRLGARLWAEQARSEMMRIGGRGPARGRITARERQVAELVAAGMKNREVAAHLIIAERTVESTLTEIYRKLEVRSRVELVRRLPRPD